MKSATNILIRLLLILAIATIAYGHVVILAGGELFDKVNREPYNLHTRWVSDFAAKWPQGSWIKGGIVLTCIATFLLYRAKLKNLPTVSPHIKESWFYHIVPLMMIVGLILVLSFDMSRPIGQWETRGIWPFQYKELVRIPKGPDVWTIEWYHKLGFRLFVVSFLAAVLGGLVFRRRQVEHPKTPIDWLILLSALICTAWLFSTMKSLPGIPQRFLLVTAFVWLWRETDTLQRSGPGRGSPPKQFHWSRAAKNRHP
jgi:hypothetical protein